MLGSPQSVVVALHRYRRALFLFSGVGLLACLAIIFLVPSAAGFALMGPLAMLPWCLGCVALSKNSVLAFFFLAMAVFALGWPLIVLFT
jgi:hypothetical protein